jgi:NAD(P)-dependent dehydrogenase (short-subunit alcohol dehydrogenase family)
VVGPVSNGQKRFRVFFQPNLCNLQDGSRDRVMKKIFLTGASSGIGLAIARSLTGNGYEVWGSSRDPSRILQVTNLHPVRLDLSDPDSIDQAFANALSQAGYFDVVINNAGSGHFGPAEHLPAPEIARQFQTLVFGHLQLTQLALKAMRSRGSGLIVNVTSLASRLPVPFMAAYNSAKAAMAVFIMSMQLELSDSGIRIVDLQPGDISTAFNDAVTRSEEHDSRYEAKVAKTWVVVDRNMKAAPKPELVARHVLKLINASNPPPRITVGDFFQSKIAPFIFRFLPQRVRIWGLKKYYDI